MLSFVTLNSHDEKIRATEFRSTGVSRNDPFFEGRKVAFDDDRTRAGVVEFCGTHTIEHFPHWELLIVTGGLLTFAIGEMELTVPAGGSLIINKAARFQITADSPASWVFLSVTADSDINPEPAILTLLDREAELFPSATIGADILVGSPPTCRNHRMQVRDDIKVRAGVWDSTPYERVLVKQQEHELMHITSGEVVFSDSEGREEKYSVGETFLVPKGVNGKWTSTVHVAKIYAVVT